MKAEMKPQEFDKVVVGDNGVLTAVTGARRQAATGKGRFDLIPPYPLMRLAQHYANGAAKYGDRNWEKGLPLARFIESAERHLNLWKDHDRTEDHLAAILWNVAGYMHTEREILCGRLPRELAKDCPWAVPLPDETSPGVPVDVRPSSYELIKALSEKIKTEQKLECARIAQALKEQELEEQKQQEDYEREHPISSEEAGGCHQPDATCVAEVAGRPTPEPLGEVLARRPPPRHCTVGELATHLGVLKATIAKWRKQSGFPASCGMRNILGQKQPQQAFVFAEVEAWAKGRGYVG